MLCFLWAKGALWSLGPPQTCADVVRGRLRREKEGSEVKVGQAWP